MAHLKYDANMAPPPDRWLALDESHAEWVVRQYHASARCTHPRTQNPILHAAFHVIVENQIAMGDKTPARATLDRLMREGLSRHDAVHAIGSVLATQVHGVLSASQSETGPGTEQYCDEMRRLTAESWRRSATENSPEAPAEWLTPGHEVTDWSTGTPDEIIAALRVPPPHFPREALRAAEEAKERLAERLLALMQDAHRAAREGAAPPDNGHIFAMMLLAELEDPRAFDVIADLFSLPADLCEDIAGDFVTEDLGRILASVCGGEIAPLARIIEDRTRWEYVRGAALTALSALVQRGQITRAAAIAYLVKLARETLADERSPILAEVANVALDLYAEELFPDVRQLIRGGLTDALAISERDVDRTERRGPAAALAALDRNAHLRPVRDVVAEVGWWHTYTDLGDDGPHHEADDREAAAAPEPARTPPRVIKIGRNDPCPCGSGSKYKKCCLGKV